MKRNYNMLDGNAVKPGLVAFTADWHLHNFTDFSKTLTVKWEDATGRYQEAEEGEADTVEMNSRLLNTLNGICDMRDYCYDNGIGTMLFGGDMFHHRGTIDVTVFNAAYKVLSTFKFMNVYAIAGNHDQTDASINPTSALHTFGELIHVYEKPTALALSPTEELVLLPYNKDKQFVLDSMRRLRKELKHPEKAVLVAHLGLNGGLVGSGMYSMKDEFTLGDLMSDDWRYVCLGHYHQPQIHHENTLYAGAPVQNNFGDERKGEDAYNGFFILDLRHDGCIKFVPIKAPRFVTVSSAAELEKLGKSFLESNFVRVKSTADHAEDIQEKLTDMLSESSAEVRLELEKEYVSEHRSDVSVTQSFDESVKTYAKENWTDAESLTNVTSVGLDILNEVLSGGK